MSIENNDTTSSVSDLTEVQTKMNKIIECVNRIIDGLEDGKKTTLRDIVDHVVAETQYKFSVVSGVVSMYMDSCPNITIKRGRDGGVFKGIKQARIDPRQRCETCGQVVRPIAEIKQIESTPTIEEIIGDDTSLL